MDDVAEILRYLVYVLEKGARRQNGQPAQVFKISILWKDSARSA